MDIDRNFAFLGSVDTKKFIVNEPKKQMQTSGTVEFRNSTQKSSIEVTFNHLFASQTLITNVEISCSNSVAFDTNFQNLEIEVSSLTNRGHYSQLINPKVEKQGTVVIFSGFGFTHCVKISLTLRNESKKKNVRQGQKEIQQYYEKILGESIAQINLYGIAINSNPSSILLTKLLNISQSFKKYNLLQEAAQANILVALSLISARRFVLAAEILRKASKFYVQKYSNSKFIMDSSRTQRSIVRQFDDEVGHSTVRSNFGTGRILEGSKFLQRAAKIELLLAETISHPSLVLQKLQAYHRCDSYAIGNTNPTPLRPDTDLEDVALTMFPQIIQFLLKVLSDKLQPFRIAALKSIQFFIQTLGCSIGAAFLHILKQVVSTYPNNFSSEINSNRIPYGLHQVEIIQEKASEQVSGSPIMKNKMLIDHYHHLLETLLSLMSLVNRKMVISMFWEIIIPGILAKNQSYQLKLYLLRFSEKAISISGADLNIEISFIGLLLGFCEQKNGYRQTLANQIQRSNIKNEGSTKRIEGSGAGHNKHIIHNLVYFSQKILSTLKLKVLPRYSGQKIESFLDWINKTLTYLGENEILSNTNSNHSMFVFTTILDFIISIYSVYKYDQIRLANSPIETVLYFTNMAIYNQHSSLCFDKILEALVVLLKYHIQMDTNFDLAVQIVSRMLEKSKSHNLSLKELQILIKIVEIVKEEDTIILDWLQIYLGCIPHSTYDQTYKVFCLLLQKGMKQIHNYPSRHELLKKIVKTMLDQYTVKGKAHQQAKEVLIQSLTKNKPSRVIDLIEVCLFNNIEPKPQSYHSKRKIKPCEHRFDSKAYKIDYELFLQKISMTQLILTTIAPQKQVCLALLEQSFIQKFFDYMKNMIQAPSLKLKGKALSLINHFIINTNHGWKDEKFPFKSFSLIIKNVFHLTKSMASKLKQSKLMYSSIYSIMNLFRCYEVGTEPEDTEDNSHPQLQKLYEETEEWARNHISNKATELPKSKGQKMIRLSLIRQFLKLWPNLGHILNSPWQNVRQIYILLILEVFKEGLYQMPQILKKKTLEMSKPLLTNLFKSVQHSEREASLKILGCLLGLRGSIDNKDNRLGQIVGDNLRFLKSYIEKVYELTFDWYQKNAEIAENLCEICLSEQSKSVLSQRRKETMCRRGANMENSYLSFNLQEEINFQRKNFSNLSSINLQNQIFRQNWLIDEESLPLEEAYCPLISEQLLYKIVQFKNAIEKQIQAKTEVLGQKESFMEQNQEQFCDMGEERAESIEGKQKSEDDQLQFEDLGIIQLDDQQWGQEQEKSEKEIQKLPMKKAYKLSPNVFSTSKPQRIRSKRFHQNEFDYRQKIIVDELEQKITSTDANEPNPQSGVAKISANNNIVGLVQSKDKQKNQSEERKDQKKLNFIEPSGEDNLDLKEEIFEQEHQYNEGLRAKQKWEKQIRKQKEQVVSNQMKQRENEKKTKKGPSKKRKASLGK